MKRRNAFFGVVAAIGGLAASFAVSAQSIPLSTDTLPLGAKIATLKYLGDLNDDLTFTPDAPCRLADTRSAAAGAIAPRPAFVPEEVGQHGGLNRQRGREG